MSVVLRHELPIYQHFHIIIKTLVRKASFLSLQTTILKEYPYILKNPYNRQLWDKILKGAKELSVAELNTTIYAIRAAEKAAKNAIELLASTYSNEVDVTEQGSSSSSGVAGGSNSDVTIEVSEEDLMWERMGDDNKLKLHYLAHKKTTLNQRERYDYLETFESDGTPRSNLFLLSAKLLLKTKISVDEEALLALSLSGIYNHLSPFTRSFYSSEQLTSNADHTAAEPLHPSLIELLNNTISKSNADDTLGYVLTEEASLCQNRKRQSDEYVMLDIAEKMWYA